MSQTPSKRNALQAIAIFEAIKGLAALTGLMGVLDLLHHDVHAVVMTWIERYHLDPKAHYPSLLLHYADWLPNADVHLLVMLASAYIALRFIEAAGLWLSKAWGEYLGALSGGIYIPFELAHLIHETSLANTAVVVLNVLIVGYLARALWQRQRHPQQP
jgi:uncharacterized membrane protein (DUF2068 family)